MAVLTGTETVGERTPLPPVSETVATSVAPVALSTRFGTAGQVITGALRSTLTVTDADAELPARSAQVALMTMPAPSPDDVLDAGQKGDRPVPPVSSAQLHITVTLVFVHPAAFGCGDRLGAAVGGVVSPTSATWPAPTSDEVPLLVTVTVSLPRFSTV